MRIGFDKNYVLKIKEIDEYNQLVSSVKQRLKRQFQDSRSTQIYNKICLRTLCACALQQYISELITYCAVYFKNTTHDFNLLFNYLCLRRKLGFLSKQTYV